MKKHLLLCAMVLISLYTSAQTIIPKVGVTSSKIAFEEDTDEMKSVVGFTLGVALNFPLSDAISLQPELNFIQKGQKLTASDGGLDVKITEKLNYIEIPVLVKAAFGEGTQFFLNAGPSIGFGLGGKYKIAAKGTLLGSPVDEEESGKIEFGSGDDEEVVYYDNSLDVGLQLGFGVLIAEKISIDARYGLGLTNLMDKVGDEAIKSQNRVLQFTVGFPLGF